MIIDRTSYICANTGKKGTRRTCVWCRLYKWRKLLTCDDRSCRHVVRFLSPLPGFFLVQTRKWTRNLMNFSLALWEGNGRKGLRLFPCRFRASGDNEVAERLFALVFEELPTKSALLLGSTAKRGLQTFS